MGNMWMDGLKRIVASISGTRININMYLLHITKYSILSPNNVLQQGMTKAEAMV